MYIISTFFSYGIRLILNLNSWECMYLPTNNDLKYNVVE